MDEIISVKLVRSKRKAPTTTQITTNDILSKPKTKVAKSRSSSQPYHQSSITSLLHDELQKHLMENQKIVFIIK